MPEISLSIVPVGKTDPREVEIVANRVSKTLKGAVEVRESVAVPRGTEDVARRQHSAARFLAALAATPARPSRTPAVFVTDVDLFTPSTEAVFTHLDPGRRVAVVSVRRLREAFYRRKADSKRQKARLAKEILWTAGRLRGLPDCPDPECPISSARVLQDIDRKAERPCRACSRRLA